MENNWKLTKVLYKKLRMIYVQFTYWGKIGDMPVRLTYDNGKLTGEPQAAVDKDQANRELDKEWVLPRLVLS